MASHAFFSGIIKELLQSKRYGRELRVLDVGCGERKKELGEIDVVGVDLLPLKGVDVVCDLSVFPWSFDDDAFDLVICDDVLEHFEDVVGVMEEIHRITRNGGLVLVSVPHFTSDNYYTDITHRRPFTSRSFDFFDSRKSGVHRYYTDACFHVRKKVIGFSEILPSGNKHFPNIHKVVGIQYLVNKFQRIYEKFFAYILPATELYFELVVDK
ncbi:MAG: hypothetical protein DRQ88_12320 [Epsilonproteobacteria bacterium]|nr:MAG: hypothetical protein DRQ88_12320 [Campylobacterota bacterium]